MIIWNIDTAYAWIFSSAQLKKVYPGWAIERTANAGLVVITLTKQ